jgi:quinoprotein glucose dehydrogenase
LLVSAYLLFRRSIAAVWIYLLTYGGTLGWALWERGFDGWGQVPRLVAPTVILVLILLIVPALRNRSAMPRAAIAASVVGFLALGTAGLALSSVRESSLLAQEAPTTQPAPAIPAAPAAPPAARAAQPQIGGGTDWPAYGGSYHAARYSPLDQITRDNVGQLERVWEFHTRDMPSEAARGRYSPENTPLKVGDNLFMCSAKGIAIAVDAMTGREEWRFDPVVADDAIPYGATCRGVAYFAVPDAPSDAACATRILWGTLDARLIAVDARTGQLCTDFGNNGEVFLEEGIGDTVPGWYAVTSAPTIVRGVAVIGAQVKDGQAENAPSGVVRGFDAVTGQLAWAWDLANPSNRGAPAEGQVYTRGTPNMWTTAAADEDLGLVYLPLGNSSVDYYGSNRSQAENEYATSLVAIDVTTGNDVWHFQTVHHDVWDYDLGSQPTLVDFPTANGTRPAVVLASKQGDIFVLDRATGESLFAIEERDAPKGGVEPDYLSPTQPLSGYHTLAFPNLTEADMWGVTPLDQLWCRIEFKRSHYEGIYTRPPVTRTGSSIRAIMAAMTGAASPSTRSGAC